MCIAISEFDALINRVASEYSFARESKSSWTLQSKSFHVTLLREYLRQQQSFELRVYINDIRFLESSGEVRANACIEIVMITLDRLNAREYVRSMTPSSNSSVPDREKTIRGYLQRLSELVVSLHDDDTLHKFLGSVDSVTKIADSAYLQWLGVDRPGRSQQQLEDII